jgi:hypothetical protein
MRRRSLHIALIVAIALLSIGEAYHYHPDGGAWWQFVGSPFAASSSTDATDAHSHATQNNPAHTCLLHFWSSLLSGTSISLPVVLAPPVRATRLPQRTVDHAAFWTTLSLSIRGPPAILS